MKDKDQQSRGEESRDFRDVNFEPTSNDHDEKQTFSCDEVIAGTDPSLPPIVKRTGLELEIICKNWRSTFTEVHSTNSA